MGRPRIHPEGSTAADRKRASLAALERAGGRQMTVRLSPRANAALRQIRDAFGDATDTDVIERLLLEEGERALRALRSRQPRT